MKKYSDYVHSSISMSKDSLFIATLEKLFADNEITNVIESGTYLGLGSTTLLAEAIIKSKKPYPNFITIEVDKWIYSRAVRNLEKYKFITPKWGLSVSAEEAEKFIQTDEAILNHEAYPEIFIDHTDNPIQAYVEEIKGHLSPSLLKRIKRRLISPKEIFTKEFLGRIIPILKEDVFGRIISRFQEKVTRRFNATFEENILAHIIKDISHTYPLFLLDSAAGIGYFEFQTVNKLMGGKPYFLILDDIHHLKHFRSYRDISKETGSYTILQKSLEHGWLVAKYEKR